MNEQQNINLVKQCYDDFLKGDIQHLLSCCAQDIEWELPAVENVPFSGKRHGVDQVGEFFKSLNDMQSAQRFEPKEFIAQGDKVVAMGHYAWTVNATGAPFESDWTHVFTIRGDKVAGFHEFTDTHAIAAAYQQQAGMAHSGARQPDTGRPATH